MVSPGQEKDLEQRVLRGKQEGVDDALNTVNSWEWESVRSALQEDDPVGTRPGLKALRPGLGSH